MAFFIGTTPNITYIGKWKKCNDSMVAENAYCKGFLMFSGSNITIIADGTLISSVDGNSEKADKDIYVSEGIHTLYFTAESGCCIKGFETEEIIDTDAYLKNNMLAEFDEITNGRKIPDKSTYKKVPYRVCVPQTDVTLTGFFGDLFSRNIDRIKRCFKEPDFIEDDNGNPSEKRGWSGYFPAANDGRVLGGAAKILCWKKDEELEKIVTSIVSKISENIRDDGYFGYYPEEKTYSATPEPDEEDFSVRIDSERKNYDRVWWTYGMIAAHESGNKKALPIVRKMYDWLENSKWRTDLIKGNNATNSLMGSLYLAETPLGSDGDLEFNLRFLNQHYYERELAQKNPAIFDKYPGNRPHCYELLELLSLAHEYRMTGNNAFLDALLGGWEVYKKYYKHPGGATAISEEGGPFPPGSYLITHNELGESCGSVFWIWLNLELSRLFPDQSQYPAEIEESLFNIIPASFTPEGKTRYHNRMQGVKESGRRAGTCCELMTTFLLSELPKYTFTYDNDTIWINQYISYSATLQDVAFDVDADISGAHTLIVTISKAPQNEKIIKIRIPDWAENAEIYVNGKLLGNEGCGTFVTISRVWKPNDFITVRFTPVIKRVRYTGVEQADSGNSKYSLFYGPYLMAVTGDYSGDVPTIKEDFQKFSCKNTSESIEININEKLRFVPYFEIGDNTKFSCFPEYEE